MPILPRHETNIVDFSRACLCVCLATANPGRIRPRRANPKPNSPTGGKKNDKLLILQERNSQGLHYNEEKSGDPFNLLGGDPRFGLSWQCELQSLQKKLQIFLRFGIA